MEELTEKIGVIETTEAVYSEEIQKEINLLPQNIQEQYRTHPIIINKVLMLKRQCPFCQSPINELFFERTDTSHGNMIPPDAENDRVWESSVLYEENIERFSARCTNCKNELTEDIDEASMIMSLPEYIPAENKDIDVLDIEDDNDMKKLTEIASRANAYNPVKYSYLCTLMDISAVHKHDGPLDLDALLKAKDGDFYHDLSGIQQNLNRKTLKLKNCFSPRFLKRV